MLYFHLSLFFSTCPPFVSHTLFLSTSSPLHPPLSTSSRSTIFSLSTSLALYSPLFSLIPSLLFSPFFLISPLYLPCNIRRMNSDLGGSRTKALTPAPSPPLEKRTNIMGSKVIYPMQVWVNATDFLWALAEWFVSALKFPFLSHSLRVTNMSRLSYFAVTPSFSNIQVSRRYKHFDWLHERLINKFTTICIPPLPEKQVTGKDSVGAEAELNRKKMVRVVFSPWWKRLSVKGKNVELGHEALAYSLPSLSHALALCWSLALLLILDCYRVSLQRKL